MNTTLTENPVEVQQAVEGFRALANLIATGTLPVPQGATIFRHRATLDEVRAFAAKHNVECREYHYDSDGSENASATVVVGRVGIHTIEFCLHASWDAS